MTIALTAVIEAFVALTAIMVITANPFVAATIAITTNKEKLIDVAAITVFCSHCGH